MSTNNQDPRRLALHIRAPHSLPADATTTTADTVSSSTTVSVAMGVSSMATTSMAPPVAPSSMSATAGPSATTTTTTTAATTAATAAAATVPPSVPSAPSRNVATGTSPPSASGEFSGSIQASGVLEYSTTADGRTVEVLRTSAGDVLQIVKALPDNHYGRTCLASVCRLDAASGLLVPDASHLVCLKFTDLTRFHAKRTRVEQELRSRRAVDPTCEVVFENPITEVRCLAQMQRTVPPCRHIIRLLRLVSIADVPTRRGASHATSLSAVVAGTTPTSAAPARPHMVEVLEAATGGEVFDFVTGGVLTLAKVHDLFRQLMEAVAHLHRNRVAHNDISAENIMLSRDGVVKLIDFGAASAFVRLRNGRARAVRRPYGLPTKKGWASPELYTSSRYFPDKHDIWACGQLLVFLLMAPQRILACSEARRGNPLFDYILEWGAGKLLAGWKPDLPRHIIRLVQQMLKPDPKLRPTADEVLAFMATHPFDATRAATSVPRPLPTSSDASVATTASDGAPGFGVGPTVGSTSSASREAGVGHGAGGAVAVATAGVVSSVGASITDGTAPPTPPQVSCETTLEVSMPVDMDCESDIDDFDESMDD